MASGTDPADAKTQARLRGQDTFRRVADAYLAQAKGRLRPKPYTETERYLLIACKSLHPRSTFNIRRRDISNCVADIATERGTVSAARARSRLAAQTSVERAIEAGKLLRVAKKQAPHGTFEELVAAHCRFTMGTAQKIRTEAEDKA